MRPFVEMAHMHNMARPIRVFAAAALATVALHAATAHAADGSREREALRRAQASLRAAQDERDAMAGEKANLTQDKTKLEGELKQTAARVRGAEAQASGLKARVAQLEASLAEQQKALTEGQAREAALAEQLRQAEAKLADQVRVASTVQALLAERTRDVQTLTAQNDGMYQAGLDAIALYKAKSPSQFLDAHDQVLGWRAVKAEGVVDALRDKLDDARFKALPAEAPAAGRVN
ncbi:MAG: hypothetical protein RI907_404 [Pseudomonadota bacterium]|jgi:septal ring factor EnvC (AmiA/AmiB activator)